MLKVNLRPIQNTKTSSTSRDFIDIKLEYRRIKIQALCCSNLQQMARIEGGDGILLNKIPLALKCYSPIIHNRFDN